MSDNSGTVVHKGDAAMTMPPDRLMRLKEVLDLTSLRRTTLYRKIQAGTFPRQVHISDRCAAWRQGAIDEWLQNPTTWTVADSEH